jgi:hypothetical protein
LLYHVAVYCLSPIEKLFSGDDDRHIAENWEQAQLTLTLTRQPSAQLLYLKSDRGTQLAFWH